ncbi:LysE family translocator [Oceanicella actignis]|uniref:Threonine/homoserine/homoserine lactone efflux protein n=1 Tax=Oceanicella actignis TaxID=1189325 RepID=A0A1M7TUG5_9RHOB|nr:LysE family translocator [Oceanicella actignis]SES78709.1 Threonine/homoserine/homoserine lactone efflux protein [Oceanicella actignis]SHN74389.1 Threonine/homoserine/homoserine lactone efflux protein [Oceanicella actignis]
MDLHTWIAFAVAAGVIVAIPGPTVMIVVSFALGQGRRAVLASAPGVLLGDLAAMSASMLGVGAALAASAALFSAVKLAGAAYLLWLGLRMWRAAPQMALGLTTASPKAPRRMFRDAFLVTLFNPKALVFFVAFVPQFIDPTRPFAPQCAILIATFATLGFVNVVIWGLAAGALRERMTRPGAMRALGRTGGGLLAGAGALAALSARG